MGLINEFSIQLYSLKDETAKDFRETLRKVSEIGYTGVEFAGYGDIPASEMKALLQELNLKSVGSHVGIEKLRNNFDYEMSYNKEIGTEFIVIPSYEMKSDEGAAKAIAEFKELIPKVNAASFKLGYHNHEYEFGKGKNGYFLDTLAGAFTADELFLELDIFWTAVAGVDYIEYMKKHSDKIKMLHIKQIESFENSKCVDLDEGAIDFAEIIKLGQKNGVKHYILEQEEFEVSPYISVEKGFKHIMSL